MVCNYVIKSSILDHIKFERNLRYGRSRPESITWYTLELDGLSFSQRLLEYNKYLLDGYVPSGEVCAYRTNATIQAPSLNGINGLRQLCDKIARVAFAIRRNQYFLDGNHRTAILTTFELIKENGYTLSADPVDMYIILSNRNERLDWTISESLYAKKLRRNTRRQDKHREKVKSLWQWNSLFCDLSAGIPLERKVLHDIKRRSPKRYIQWTKLNK